MAYIGSLGLSEHSGFFTELLLQFSGHQILRFSQLTGCLGLQLGYPPRLSKTSSFTAMTCRDLWPLLCLWRLRPALYLLHVPSPAPANITDRNVPPGIHSWRFLSWSLSLSLATRYLLPGRQVSHTAVWAVSLIGRLEKFWCLGHHLRARVHLKAYSLLQSLAYFPQIFFPYSQTLEIPDCFHTTGFFICSNLCPDTASTDRSSRLSCLTWPSTAVCHFVIWWWIDSWPQITQWRDGNRHAGKWPQDPTSHPLCDVRLLRVGRTCDMSLTSRMWGRGDGVWV